MKIDQIFRNVRTLAAHPSILRHYLRWAATKIATGSAKLTVLGARLEGFPNFSSYLGAVGNAITDAEVEFITPRIAEAEVIFDVGANFGAFAIPFARLAPHARVFAFEPNPQTALALRENLQRNGVTNVTVVEAAVSDREGQLIFSDTADPATNRILTGGGEGVRVTALTIESFCLEHGIDRIDFLKIDVEGAELSVLEGARNLFEAGAIGSGLIEICPGNLRNFGRSISDLTDFFKQAKVDLVLLGDRQGEPIDDRLLLENAGFDCAPRGVIRDDAS